MAVIMDYYFNNTRIIVKDDYFKPEKTEEILEKIGEIAALAINSDEQQEDKTA